MEETSEVSKRGWRTEGVGAKKSVLSRAASFFETHVHRTELLHDNTEAPGPLYELEFKPFRTTS